MQPRFARGYCFILVMQKAANAISRILITPKACISFATCCGISSMRSIVYHQSAGDTRRRVMIYAFGDDIHACA